MSKHAVSDVSEKSGQINQFEQNQCGRRKLLEIP